MQFENWNHILNVLNFVGHRNQSVICVGTNHRVCDSRPRYLSEKLHFKRLWTNDISNSKFEFPIWPIKCRALKNLRFRCDVENESATIYIIFISIRMRNFQTALNNSCEKPKWKMLLFPKRRKRKVKTVLS